MTEPLAAARLSAQDPLQHFHAIAQLHVEAIHHGALPFFGESFLAHLYRQLARTPRAGVWGVMHAGEVVGFLAGCADVRACYRSVLLRGGFPLALRAASLLYSRTLWRKLPALVRYPLQQARSETAAAQSATAAELLAIAVKADWRGRGIGATLVRAFESSLQEWHVSRYQVATNSAEPGSNAFYRRSGFVATDTVRHHDLVLQRYCKGIGEILCS
jgi:GNAT superfamily N-acetyltransferase